MPVSSRTLRQLADLKLSPEQMSGVLVILAETAEADEERLANQRERKRRSRSGHVTVTGQSQDKGVTDPPPKERSPTPPKEITPSRRSAPLLSPREILVEGLGEPLADRIWEHRQKIRKPMSGDAARLMVGQVSRCRDPTAAVDEMVLRGWTAVKAEWMEREDGKRNQQNGKRGGAHDTIFRALADKAAEEPGGDWGPPGPDGGDGDHGRGQGDDQGQSHWSSGQGDRWPR
jgi:hypothetical protein